ncbi:GAD-like domain-containing protein [Acinetobacter sp. ANC 3832]|uniref:GAD-like domain-containing protein n=1 Tax=Acinetobacter sp. ANC 3832 TaxID=1977874 RepID=UPI000A33276F|nr:GAD-like domain-containing protein [Acinetobacter sp. ANC 3832]OTG90223.1 GAD-like protein [Acinetobacter sp. ANC 3832]
MQLQEFINKFPVDQIENRVSDDIIEKYKAHLPEALLELWKIHSFGFYGNGLIQIINPELYQSVLWDWLMKSEPDMTRLPIAISAFGVIFYYRKLSDEDEDISFIDAQTSEVDVTVWSMSEFFNDWLCSDEIIDVFLEKTLLEKAQDKYGKLKNNQMYCFLPALRLGGRKDDLNLDKGDAATHLDFLYQLAMDS